MSAPTQYVYEVVYATDEERYFHLGVFLSEQEAIASLQDDEPPVDDDGQNSVLIEVRRVEIGWNPHSAAVIASRTWVRNYSAEEDDEGEWKAHEIKLNTKENPYA